MIDKKYKISENVNRGTIIHLLMISFDHILIARTWDSRILDWKYTCIFLFYIYINIPKRMINDQRSMSRSWKTFWSDILAILWKVPKSYRRSLQMVLIFFSQKVEIPLDTGATGGAFVRFYLSTGSFVPHVSSSDVNGPVSKNTVSPIPMQSQAPLVPVPISIGNLSPYFKD